MAAIDTILRSLSLDADSSIAGQIYNHLKDLILSGQLPPGYPLPGEIRLCTDLGVGRSTVREAMRALETLGLIRRTKRGTCVSERIDNFDNLPMGDMLALSDVGEIQELRRILEVEVAGLAAQRATEANLRTMRCCIEGMTACRQDVGKVTSYDTQFHMELAKATQNKLLLQTLEAMRNKLYGYMSAAFAAAPDMRDRAIRFHSRLCNAVAARDSETARSVMREHLLDTEKP